MSLAGKFLQLVIIAGAYWLVVKGVWELMLALGYEGDPKS